MSQVEQVELGWYYISVKSSYSIQSLKHVLSCLQIERLGHVTFGCNIYLNTCNCRSPCRRRPRQMTEERGIPFVGGNISYTHFLDKNLRLLKPCLITTLTEDWAAAREWTCHDPTTRKMIPNIPHLRALFGAETGCITFCAEADNNGELIQRDLPVSSFFDSLESNASRRTYLKDFHFMRHLRKHPYSVPTFFAGSSTSQRILM